MHTRAGQPPPCRMQDAGCTCMHACLMRDARARAHARTRRGPAQRPLPHQLVVAELDQQLPQRGLAVGEEALAAQAAVQCSAGAWRSVTAHRGGAAGARHTPRALHPTSALGRLTHMYPTPACTLFCCVFRHPADPPPCAPSPHSACRRGGLGLRPCRPAGVPTY